MVCNCLIADVIDDGVFTGGFVPAVAHALDELLVRQEPVLVPTAVSAMAQAFGVKPSGFEVQGAPGSLARHQLDLSAIDQYRYAALTIAGQRLRYTTYCLLCRGLDSVTLCAQLSYCFEEGDSLMGRLNSACVILTHLG